MKINEAFAGSLIAAQPVVSDLESASILPAKAMYKPPFATNDSAFSKEDSILNVFDAGAKGSAEDKFKVLVFELTINIGDKEEPPASVILKYMFAYAFVGNALLNAEGIAIVVVEEPLAANVPVIGVLFAPKVYVVKVCVFPFAELYASLKRIICA